MPELAQAATYRQFSWLRQGLLAGMTNARDTSNAAGHLVLPIRLRINNQRNLDVPVQFYGPGGVTGLEAREVIRTDPQHLMPDFEPNDFPMVEFDQPDLAWRFTLAVPDVNQRLHPWICLVVVRKEHATLTATPNQPLPVLACPRRELPTLTGSWAWAHA